MPFGLKGAPSHFQKTIQAILKKAGVDCVFVFIDNIVVFGNNVKDMWAARCAVLRALTQARMMTNRQA